MNPRITMSLCTSFHRHLVVNPRITMSLCTSFHRHLHPLTLNTVAELLGLCTFTLHSHCTWTQTKSPLCSFTLHTKKDRYERENRMQKLVAFLCFSLMTFLVFIHITAGKDSIIHLPSGLDRVDCDHQEAALRTTKWRNMTTLFPWLPNIPAKSVPQIDLL